MEVSREPRLLRWLIIPAMWVLVVVLAWRHMEAMRDYVAMLDRAGRAEPMNATPLRRPVPGNYADAQAWVRYALAARDSSAWQQRRTDLDNAPHGRELHWNSAFLHYISTAGLLQAAFTGEAQPQATENALAWLNLPLLLGAIALFSCWSAARGGAGAGVLVAAGMIGLQSFYEGFTPNYADHHGLLTTAAFGLTLGVVFMGAGWWRGGGGSEWLLPGSREAARRAAIVSALCGALGMGISAASIIPVIAIVGLAGLGAGILFGRRARQEGATFEPDLWRLWGRVGAGASFLFYLLEYAPSHLGFRLEVNHPFHALAWWGAGELIALGAAWQLDRAKARPRPAQLVLPLLSVLATPVTLVVGGAAVFLVRDPFVAELRHTVGEGMSFRAAAQAFGAKYAQAYLINFILVAAGLLLLCLPRRERVLLGFATLTAAAFVGLACWEIRWWLIGSGPMLCLLLVMAAAIAARRQPVTQWVLILGLAALLLPSGAYSGARTLRAAVRAQSADAVDVMQPVYRDIASTLRATQPAGDIVLLSSPDASNGIGYYGRFKSVGTLYWENVDGLKAAAAIFGAERDEDAAALIRARGITHLAMISRGNFLAEYFRLSRPAAPSTDLEKTFGHRLLVQERPPRWLRALPYQLPASAAVPGLSVLLLQVVPDQGEFNATWNLAHAQLAAGRIDAAQRNLLQAIATGPADQRAALLIAAGDSAYQRRANALALRLYRAALALGENAGLTARLAWLLATSTDASLRDAREALALAEPNARANLNQVMPLDAWAAALAENNRFADAVEVLNHAMSVARAANEAATIAVLQQRLDAYRAGRPWRQ